MQSLACLVVVVALLTTPLFGIGETSAEPEQPPVEWSIRYDEKGGVAGLSGPGSTGYTERIEDGPGGSRLVRRVFSDGREVECLFDYAGRRLRMVDPLGCTAYAYDPDDRLISVRRDGMPILAIDYDQADRAVGLRLEGHGETRRYFDSLGRVSRLVTPGGEVRYEYGLGNGRIVRTLPNGVFTVWEFAADDALTKPTHARRDGSVIARFTYHYRPDRLIAAIDEWTPRAQGRVEYCYDVVGRLTAASDSRHGDTRFEYGPTGDRVTMRRRDGTAQATPTDWAGRILSIDGAPCIHDGAGNLIRVGESQNAFAFGADGLLSSAAIGTQKVAYHYDGDGNLIERKSGEERTRFLCEPDAPFWKPVLAVDDEDRGSATLFVWEGTVPLAACRAGDTTYFLTDHLGSVRMLVDGDGNTVSSIDYEPFGAPRSLPSAQDLFPAFAGLFHDHVVGLTLMRRRAYWPVLGRFLQHDPVLEFPPRTIEGRCPYGYAGFDPVNRVDLDGGHSQAAPYGSSAGFPGMPGISGPTFHGRVMNYVNDVSRQLGVQPGDEVGLVFLGINERFEDAWRYTVENFRSGDKIIVIPTYEGPGPRWLDGIRTVNDFLRTSVPPGFPAVSLSPVPITFNTRKVGLPELLDRMDSKGIRVKALVFSSGGNFVLQSNVANLVAWAQKHNDPPKIGVMSGSISAQAHQKPLEGAGFTVEHLGEDSVVAALESRWADHAPARISPLGMPGYLAKILHIVATRRDELLSDYRAPDRAWNGYWLPRKRGHGYGARKDIVREFVHPRRHMRSELLPDFRPDDDVCTVLDDDLCASLLGGGASDEPGGPGGPSGGGPGGGPRGPGGPGSGFGGLYPMTPSDLGGVALAGAQRALDQLGSLEGVAIDDQTGRLLLIAGSKPVTTLPSLPLDVVAAVFRAVYRYEPPWLSLDPDPANPRGGRMLVRTGPGTHGYIAWVLFECDRFLKVLTLGRDNITDEPVSLGVRGYETLLTLGADDSEEKTETWERFWIVPDPNRVRRRDSRRGALQLLEVPLKLNVQRMVLSDGKLVPADDDTPSKGARLFAQWFDCNFDQIAEHVELDPPAGSGLTAKVRVYQELRRIAIITAIAETLRDRGVPMPSWVDEVPLRPFPVPPSTPAITVSATSKSVEVAGGKAVHTTATRHIYGGIDLGVPLDDVFIERESPIAEALVKALDSTRGARLSASESFELVLDDRTLRVAALPGASTRGVGAARLQVTDVACRLPGGAEIALTRSWSSFHAPTGALGRGWTLDLPRLDRSAGKSGEITYQLTTPLATCSETFREKRHVAALDADLIAPAREGPFLGIGELASMVTGERTCVVVLADGRRWHFDDEGAFTGWSDGQVEVAYRRHPDGYLAAIEGWSAGVVRGRIELEWGVDKTIASATADNGSRVSYRYTNQRLTQVEGGGQNLRYIYQGDLLTGVQCDDQKILALEYDEHRRLMRECQGKALIQYTIEENDKETVVHRLSGAKSDSVAYDRRMRPLRRELASGSVLRWEHGDDGLRVFVESPSRGSFTLLETSAGRERWHSPTRQDLEFITDAADRVIEYSRNGKRVATYRWLPDGRPLTARHDDFMLHYECRENGSVASVVITPPTEGDTFSEWVRVRYDVDGQPAQITDQSGFSLEALRNESDAFVGFVSSRGSILIARDAAGRVKEIDSPLGTLRCVRGEDGRIVRVERALAGAVAGSIDVKGRGLRFTAFDGAAALVTPADGDGATLNVAAPKGLALTVQYDRDKRCAIARTDAGWRLFVEHDTYGRPIRIARARDRDEP